jgi:cobalt-precorrin-5B (C1)-methyltransferase
MSLERYVWAGGRRLRCGYTTGSCAAMAAGAAAGMAAGGPVPATARLVTPSGVAVEADVLEPRLGTWEGSPCASCAVRKDGGDDVDATDGLLVRARVRLERGTAGEVRVVGGPGVGRVTLPGLDQPVGQAAINSVPRAMIAAEVTRALRERGRECAAVVEVSVPGGERVAARTFNPQLGIQGGISILGTSGIVEPMSVRALCDTVDLQVRQLAETGAAGVVLVPGNYGADFVAADPTLTHIPLVRFSNYLGSALDSCARHGISRVLVVGHAGKLFKVAAGVMDTHSRTADCRLETLCAHAALCGADAGVARAVFAAPTTEAALDVLDDAGLLAPVMASVTDALGERLRRRAAGSFAVEAIMFSTRRGELGRTAGADALVAEMDEAGGDAHER